MRVAVFSDIHGNSIALDAVLADITARGGADAYWVLGDLVAIGADPVDTLERLAALPNPTFVQGNTQRYLLTGERDRTPRYRTRARSRICCRAWWRSRTPSPGPWAPSRRPAGAIGSQRCRSNSAQACLTGREFY